LNSAILSFTPSTHALLFNQISDLIIKKQKERLENGEPPPSSTPLPPLRLREVLLDRISGSLVLSVFLDRGYLESSNLSLPVFWDALTEDPPPADASVDLDDCLMIHHWLLESEAVSLIPDGTEIQVSSPGAEPFLRSVEDFVSSVGLILSVKCWEKQNGRDKFVMMLDAVNQDEGGEFILLKEGSHQPKLYLNQIAKAQALSFHPLSLSKSKQSGPGKTKAKKLKKS
jgi:ribosome maturation factor RimP